MTNPKVGHIFRLAQIIQESCERCTDQEATSLAKAILEHPGSRWCPQQTPEPEGPTDEEIDDWHGRCADLTRLGEADHYWAFDLRHDEVADVVRAALARWGRPAIEPVPVAERLPGREDCDAGGRCWWAANDGIYDHWRKLDLDKALNNPWRPTHWLPHWALPVPISQEAP